ncbi:uncharacterized protein N7483_008768 [Penicillium malachiteum]|uniref:uncharacterized protein n=1 Tax=Penicillium malachiteum TaxID=1324776 RepID=UPI0025487962|nr:uncharacterized protein N7483_008768 [Penicillium malachiteum]KAJ5720834.1 hypothetical protein N7483_008768 [Penicillium malachiteum]
MVDLDVGVEMEPVFQKSTASGSDWLHQEKTRCQAAVNLSESLAGSNRKIADKNVISQKN